ncbi:VOC family protein [Radiobacillus deserti]|uniref:VOC family protein n=1 Tax=Radiobacillus deserti TaxID=2594883 RepID=A0A516KI99_9BACI|nr:VOC family protein [Radiobacillus deserti]QDP41125.1 VOC family protein [Radiobacillus deserti]
MIFEMTIQVRVTDMEKGQAWYKVLFKREPDFVPHDGFAEWEIIPGCWLQVAEGNPIEGGGPLRFGVTDIEVEKGRLMEELEITDFEIYSRPEVPVKWGTCTDPWGNRIGFFEYVDKQEQNERIRTVLGEQ